MVIQLIVQQNIPAPVNGGSVPISYTASLKIRSLVMTTAKVCQLHHLPFILTNQVLHGHALEEDLPGL